MTRSSALFDRSAPVAEDAALDIVHLKRMTLGERRLECEVLRLFDRQATMLLARMQGAPPANVSAFAHTLKGSARGIGAWQAAKAAEALELAANDCREADLAQAHEQLAEAVAAVSAAIAGRLHAER